MTGTEKKIIIHVNVEVTTDSLERIVENSKTIAGCNEKGHFRVDTADMVSNMISRFLEEKKFEDYVKDISNYSI